MTFRQYIDKTFRPDTLAIISQANDIINEYAAQGYDLTLRQLYYQFVARDILANSQANYKRLGSIVSDARLAGLISWTAIVDRTRNVRGNSHWQTPEQVLKAARNSFYMDRWQGQPRRVEVWIEKDALVGVIEKPCKDLDVSFFSCRGYVSQSEQWNAAQRLLNYEDRGIAPLVLHLGDHDPSGIDMTRDIADRLRMFGCYKTKVKRIALNMEQVEETGPPPNPTKLTDTRAESYIVKYGRDCWELDALDPTYLGNLIRRQVVAVRVPGPYEDVLWREKQHLETIDRLIEKARG
jgi:hypothetical protein